MHIRARHVIDEFVKAHPNTKPTFDNWVAVTREAVWQKPTDIKNTFSKASYVPKKQRAVFRLGGKRNDRMIAQVNFQSETVTIDQILQRGDKEYDSW